MKKFKSIKTELLCIVLSLIIIGMLSISFLGYFYSKSIINDEIAEKMNHQTDYITEGIEKTLLKHDQLANTLSKAVEASVLTGDEKTYISMIKKVVTTNDDTFGSGIWFEPYQSNSEQKYFGPYAYKDNDNVYITMDYSNEKYDYFKYDWYQDAKNNDGMSSWSDPYYDETSDITMITTSVPFYNSNNNFMGVVTADINLDSIQELISETKVGESGHAFLLSNDGTYISHKDSEKIMKQNILNESNKELAEMGKKILETKEGQGTYLESNGKYQIFYSQIPKTNWIIGLTISEKELYSSLNNLLITNAITLLIVLIVVSFLIINYANKLSTNMGTLNEMAESLSKGDFTVKSNINLKNEIGALSNSFNIMIKNIKNLLTNVIEISNQVADSSVNLASTSQEVSASSEEVTRAVDEIACGANDQAKDAEQGTMVASSLDKKFEQLKENSNIMHENANNVNEANKKGMLTIKDLIVKTDLNNQYINKAEKTVGELNIKSNNISEILETISSIAEQTNLLSLNASIEAARAGEAGRGFVVVADEIRKLAEDSETATNRIRNIVEELQTESNNTVDIMSEVKSKIQEQTNAVSDVNTVFNTINESIEMIAKQIENVYASIDDISEDKDKIVSSIENIASVSEETAAASEEVAASVEQQTSGIEKVAENAEKLSDFSVSLNEQINKFKI